MELAGLVSDLVEDLLKGKRVLVARAERGKDSELRISVLKTVLTTFEGVEHVTASQTSCIVEVKAHESLAVAAKLLNYFQSHCISTATAKAGHVAVGSGLAMVTREVFMNRLLCGDHPGQLMLCPALQLCMERGEYVDLFPYVCLDDAPPQDVSNGGPPPHRQHLWFTDGKGSFLLVHASDAQTATTSGPTAPSAPSTTSSGMPPEYVAMQIRQHFRQQCVAAAAAPAEGTTPVLPPAAVLVACYSLPEGYSFLPALPGQPVLLDALQVASAMPRFTMPGTATAAGHDAAGVASPGGEGMARARSSDDGDNAGGGGSCRVRAGSGRGGSLQMQHLPGTGAGGAHPDVGNDSCMGQGGQGHGYSQQQQQQDEVLETLANVGKVMLGVGVAAVLGYQVGKRLFRWW